MDYYIDLAMHLLRECLNDASSDARDSDSAALPFHFMRLISLYENGRDGGPFPLTNRDFGAHNLLVNDNFEIIGPIDLDGVIAAPIGMVAQYPALTWLQREPPGFIHTNPFAIECIRMTVPNLIEYQQSLARAESRVGGNESQKTPIADMMLSNVTSVIQGLLEYEMHSSSANDNRMVSYRWLRMHDKPERVSTWSVRYHRRASSV